jgi:hypothetical protein
VARPVEDVVMDHARAVAFACTWEADWNRHDLEALLDDAAGSRGVRG